MRYNLESMLPERAFQKKLGGYAPATLEGGGGAPAAPTQPTNQTITTSNIAPWAQPGVSSLIQSAMQNVYPNQTTNPDGSVTLGNQAGYTPFNYNTALNQPTSAQGQALSAAESTVAGFSPLQQQAQQSAYNLQVPGQYNQASNMAGMAGIMGLNSSYNPMTAGYNQVNGAQSGIAQLGNAPRAAVAQGNAQNMQGAIGSAQNMQGAIGSAQDMQAAIGSAQNMQGATGSAQDMQSAQLGNTPESQAAQFGGPQNVNAQNVGTQDYTGQNVQNYMSPYMQNVVDTQMREANRNYDISGAQQQGQATQSGAFGGGREAIMAAENERNRNTALNSIQAQGSQNAFQNAQQQFNTQQQANLQAQQANQGANLQAGMANQNMGYNTGLQNAQLQQQTGLANQQMQGQYGLQQGQFNQAANQANQQAQNQFGMSNLSNQQAANAANQQAGNQFGMSNLSNQQAANAANQQAGNQFGLANMQSQNQANAANQQAQNQFGMSNLSNQQAANAANQQAGNQFGLANMQSQNQANLANQQLQGQYGLSNMQAMNQGNQFNAQNRQQANLANQQAALQAQQANINQQQFGANYGMQGLQQANQSASTLGNLGGQQLAAQQGILGTQNQLGGQQQQQNQNTLNQAMTNYNTAQTMPMTQLGQLESLYTGAPQNITSTGYTAAPSTVSQVAGLGGAAIAGAKLAGMKQGGLAKTKNFDVGGSVEYKLRGLAETDPAAFRKQVALTTSPEEKKIERQVAIDEGIAIKKGGKIFENMASGGIVAFGKGGEADLNAPEASMGDESNQPDVTNNQQTPDRMALASKMQDAGQAYLNATKNSTVDPKTQGLWRLLQGGLDVAGQTGPNALTNIAKGSQAAVAGAMQDVSEQKKAAMQRAQSEYDVSKFDTSTLMEIAKNANEDRNKELDRLMRKGLSEIQANATIEASLNALKGHQAQAAATGANTTELGKTRLLAEQNRALDRYQDNVLNVAKSLIPSNKSWDTATTAERKNAYNEATKMVEKPDFSSTNKGNNTEPPPPFGHELDKKPQ